MRSPGSPRPGRSAPVPPSNRGGTGSKSEPQPARLGVDRLSLSFPLRSYERQQDAWSSVSTALPGSPNERRNYATTVEVGEARCMVGVSEFKATGQAWGKIELNPAKVFDGGWRLRGLEEVPDAVNGALRAAREFMVRAGPREEAKVKRIDVARDFDGVKRPSDLIRALAPLPRPWARQNLVHADPSRAGAQTLMVGSRSGGYARLYDKHAETDGSAPPGTLRWEAECRPSWLQTYGHITTLKTLTNTSLDDLAKNRWEWSAMGAQTTAASRLVDVVMDAEELTDTERVALVGFVMIQAAGRSMDRGKATLAKYRRIQRKLGLSLDLADLQGSGVVSRLDWESGTEVFSVAA